MDLLNKGIFTVVIATVVTSAMILLVDSSVAENKIKVDATSQVSTTSNAKELVDPQNNTNASMSDGQKSEAQVNQKVKTAGVLPPPGPFAKESMQISPENLNKPSKPNSPTAPSLTTNTTEVKKPVINATKPEKSFAQPTMDVASPQIKPSPEQPKQEESTLQQPVSPKQPESNVTSNTNQDVVKPKAPQLQAVAPQPKTMQQSAPKMPPPNGAIKRNAPIWSKGNQASLGVTNPPVANWNLNNQQQYMYAPMPNFYAPNMNTMGYTNYYYPSVPQVWMPPIMPNQSFQMMNGFGNTQTQQINQSPKNKPKQ